MLSATARLQQVRQQRTGKSISAAAETPETQAWQRLRGSYRAQYALQKRASLSTRARCYQLAQHRGAYEVAPLSLPIR